MRRRRKNPQSGLLYPIVLARLGAMDRVFFFDRRPTWFDIAQRLGHHDFEVVADLGRINVVAPFHVYVDFDARSSTGIRTADIPFKTSGAYVELVVANMVPSGSWITHADYARVFPRLRVVSDVQIEYLVAHSTLRQDRYDTLTSALGQHGYV